MRNIVLSILVATLLPITVQAEDHVIYNAYGERVGKAVNNGDHYSVRNIYGQEVGRIQSNGYTPPVTVHIPRYEDFDRGWDNSNTGFNNPVFQDLLRE